MSGKRLFSTIRKPVLREGAERHVLYTLLCFAASVGLTRLFLELTGYPQLGGGELHIAHVLWGGLLLFAASLMPLIFANRWVYPAGAVLAGLGVGLFIDEVGKFITQTNDYFYPAAAPIVYALFLLTVLLFLQVRRPFSKDARAELYRALDVLQEVLDRDLEATERVDLQKRLQHIAEHAEHPNVQRLTQELEHFLLCEEVVVVPEKLNILERALIRLRAFEERWITENRVRGLLTGALVGIGLAELLGLSRLLIAAGDPLRLERMVAQLVAVGQVASASGMGWFTARLAMESAVGLIILASAGFLLAGSKRLGVHLAYLGLLLLLAAINLLVFYFEQFSTIIPASIEFLVLLGVLYYRRRYLAWEVNEAA